MKKNNKKIISKEISKNSTLNNNKKFEKIYCLDTNIILNDAQNLITISENGKNLIILPETVLDEIDDKKSGFDEINFQAREFGRILYEAKIIGVKKIRIKKEKITIVETKVQNTTIYIISKNKYKADRDNVPRSIKNDRKILEITKDFMRKKKWSSLTFISLDVMARTRSISLAIPTEAMNLGNSNIELNFTKTIELDDDEEVKNGDNILDFDPDYEISNFNYIFNKKGHYFLATVKNGKIDLINENDLNKQIINPIGLEQKFFSNALLDDFYDILVVDALAGSGKTLLALSAAMELVKRKKYKKIIYIRNSIESLAKGEDVGYLSSNEAKFEIYNFPLYDTLAHIANKMLIQSNKNKSMKDDITQELIDNKVEELMERYNIETMWVGSMRGRTIDNAVVIKDEWQNASNSTGQLSMSRIDNTCKLIVLGSNRQIDNQYITKHTNALTTLLLATKEEHEEVNLFGIELTKVMRGPITKFAEKIYENKK